MKLKTAIVHAYLYCSSVVIEHHVGNHAPYQIVMYIRVSVVYLYRLKKAMFHNDYPLRRAHLHIQGVVVSTVLG